MLNRSRRISELLKSEISDIIGKRLKDPLVGFVTITDVVLSDDLRIAKVYFSVLGDADKKRDSLKGLERARAFIQNELGSRVRLRYLPVLHFYLDESWNYGSRIDQIIDRLQHDEPSHSCDI
ncbi:30S ribosome-binding factor RbfA [bacterium]|nr:30S ribosome-binding factor RbfA [bacterium]